MSTYSNAIINSLAAKNGVSVTLVDTQIAVSGGEFDPIRFRRYC